MISEIRAILAPLRDLKLHIERCESRKVYGIAMWDELCDDTGYGANRMTTMIYSLEKAVQFMNIIRNARYGVITRRVWDHLDSQRNNNQDEADDIFFGIPEDCVIKVEDDSSNSKGSKLKMCLLNANVVAKSSPVRPRTGDETANAAIDQSFDDDPFALAPEDSGNEEEILVPAQTNNYHLLKATLYSYKRVNLSDRLKDADLKRLPRHTQTLGGQMSKDSILPKGEEHLKAKIIQAFFEFTETKKEKNRARKYDIPMFQKRRYRYIRYKNKKEEEIKELYNKLATICWDAYDASWMMALRQRKWYREKKEPGYTNNANISLLGFPTTKTSFDRWHGAQAQDGSMTLLQSKMGSDWISGTATVTNAIELYQHCFAPSEKCLKGRWNKFLSVRLFKFISCILRDIYAYLKEMRDHNRKTIYMWSVDAFREWLFISMERCRVRATGDESMFLVWDLRSEDKAYWDWRRIRPIIVMPISGLPERSVSSLIVSPTLRPAKMIDFMFPFRTDAVKRKGSGKSGPKDNFYKMILPDNTKIQLNDIIASRIILAIKSKFEEPNTKPVSMKTCAETLVFETGPKVLGKVFSYNQKGFESKIHDVKVKLRDTTGKYDQLISYAKQNMTLWDKSEKDELKIFKDTAEEETRMKDFINNKDLMNVMRMAHEGKITEEFLDLLIQLRDKYDSMKFEKVEDIASELNKFLEK